MKLIDKSKIRIKNAFPDTEGYQYLDKALEYLVSYYAKRSYDFYKAVYHVPFIYKERQLGSLIIPALDHMMDALLTEHPVKREWSNNFAENNLLNQGWVDFWSCKDDLSYYIELKQGEISYSYGEMSKAEIRKWNQAYAQLNAVSHELKNEVEHFDEVLKVVLHIMPIYTENQRIMEFEDQKLLKIQENALDNVNLEIQPNWSALWDLRGSGLENVNSKSEGKLRYPAILFLVSAEKVE